MDNNLMDNNGKQCSGTFHCLSKSQGERNSDQCRAGAPKSLMTNFPLLTIVSRLVKCADVPVQFPVQFSELLKMVFVLHRLHVPYFPSACVA